ncbi:hypothetical protein FQR65_LT08733 [Abscondita terminalis]|nr:hypothetical protein FQR65_LT08733 [Abscondita terminalis]
MAAVVSHAMRRFPTSPLGSSYSNCLDGESSWPQEDITESSLSRSMRYAEPWLYGSMRAPAGFVLTPALVLCSCTEYLTGTKRSSKKGPAVCKKCGGTRLPLPSKDTMQSGSKFGTIISRKRVTLCIEIPIAHKNYPKQSGSSTQSGRKSILECNINPYDLISVDQDKEKDPSITLVGGQRVRVCPPDIEQEQYEDVNVQPVLKTSQIPKIKSPPENKQTKLALKFKEKESDCNRFKSILKKPTTFSDTDSSVGPERSPSPALKSGSHFYLPMPMNTPRKKVQFLVENKLIRQQENHPDTDFIENGVEVVEESHDVNIYEEVPECEEEEPDAKVHVLKRSISERFTQETSKAIFYDTTALRSKCRKNDSRNAFDAIVDIQKLDGLVTGSVEMKPKSNVVIEKPKTEQPEIVVENKETPKTHDDKEDKKTVIENDEVFEIVAEVDPIPEKIDLISVTTKASEEVVVPPMAPPRKRSNSKQPLSGNLEVKSPKMKTKPDYSNKTVVQIRAPSAVHKIQIKNEFSDNNVQTVVVTDNAQRKTSILINGDDCYSTINVNDDIPMYQSSVVVKDTGNEPLVNANKSSTVYITGNFTNDDIKTPVPLKTFTETFQEISPLSTKDQKTIFEETNEDLKELLKDPVEAVKRNLVPHVCGKSDVLRRPSGRKLSNVTSCLLERTAEMNMDALIQHSLAQLRDFEYHDEDDKDAYSEHSSMTQYEMMDPGSDCYTDNSNRSSLTEEELNARTKFYEMLADSAISEISESEDHHYESIRLNPDPIYEEINPPPLPANPPPSSIMDDLQLDKQFTTRSIFEGASKYDILSYLVDAKERGIVPEESYNFGNTDVVIEEDGKDVAEQYRVSHISDSSEDNSLVVTNGLCDDKMFQKSAEVERNDSGVGSETSKSSLSRFRIKSEPTLICEDCETSVETQSENEPLICRKCMRKRSERKEIITEIVETEEKYSRDLQIILEEFYQPMLVAGLLTPDQLSAIFLNVEELLENSQALAERLRDAVEIAVEQGDEDLLTVNIGKLFLEAAPMLHAFETYCIRQGNASLLLASLEKEKELLRIFLRVSQMENTMLRRMNLNSFLMVPVQRVTKYPLLLTRLYKTTPSHYENRDQLKEAQHKIELHLNHMNSETKDVPSKLWRRIGSSSGRRPSSEMDLVSIKLRKIAVDVLEWNHDEAKFALEGKLLFTQPTDNNWRKGRTIKLAPINAMLVTNGKMFSNRPEDDGLTFPKNGVREAALLLVRDKNGRYSMLREPLYLDRCIIATDPAWNSYFEVQEVISKDTFIFKAGDDHLTRQWYRQLQFHAQGLGGWRKRRNALANIMISGMGLRS